MKTRQERIKFLKNLVNETQEKINLLLEEQPTNIDWKTMVKNWHNDLTLASIEILQIRNKTIQQKLK